MGLATAEAAPPLTLPEVQKLLEDRAPPGLQAYDPFWLSRFRINERKVKDYRKGRAFLAGDAAHIHSPAGGQGMNTGMQDAFNLAWKLALVWHGPGQGEPARQLLAGAQRHRRSGAEERRTDDPRGPAAQSDPAGNSATRSPAPSAISPPSASAWSTS